MKMGEKFEFNPSDLAKLLVESEPDIILLHTPPYLLCDNTYQGQNWGAPKVTQYLAHPNLKKSPKLIAAGHVHEAGPSGNNPAGVKGLTGYQHPQTGKVTMVVNPGNLGRFELVNPHNLDTHLKLPYGTFNRVDLEEDGSLKKLVQYALDTLNRGIGNVRQIREFDVN